MITRDDLKKELDKLPESVLDEVYSLLTKIKSNAKSRIGDNLNLWKTWIRNLDNFTPDFMNHRDQSMNEQRESFD